MVRYHGRKILLTNGLKITDQMSSHIKLGIVLKKKWGGAEKITEKNIIFVILSLVFALFTLKFLIKFLPQLLMASQVFITMRLKKENIYYTIPQCQPILYSLQQHRPIDEQRHATIDCIEANRYILVFHVIIWNLHYSLWTSVCTEHLLDLILLTR